MFNHTFIRSIIATSLLCTTQMRSEESATLHTTDPKQECHQSKSPEALNESLQQRSLSSYYALPPLLSKMVKICTQDLEITNERIEAKRGTLQSILNNCYHSESIVNYFMFNPPAKKIVEIFKKAVDKQKPLLPNHMISCLSLITKALQQHIIEHYDTIEAGIKEKLYALYGDSTSDKMLDITEHFLTALALERRHKRLAQTFFFINNLITTLPEESQNAFIKNIMLNSTVLQSLQEGFVHPDVYLSIRSLPDITTLFPQLEKTNKLPPLLKPYTNLLVHPELCSLIFTTLHECITPMIPEEVIILINAMVTTLSEPSKRSPQE